MCDTVDEEITADTVAAQVELERDAHAGAILIVEGDSDSLFFKHLIDRESCKIVVADGKENAIGAINKLTSEEKHGILCVVDADYHHLGISKIPNNKNIIITDYHDIEITMIESSALEKYIDNYASREKLSQLKKMGQDVRDIIYDCASIIGAMRFWSIKSGHNLTFNKLANTGYAFICMKDLNVDREKLINSIKNASGRKCIDNASLNNEIDTVLHEGYDRRQICNGHDVTWVLSRALRRLIGSEPEKSVSNENVEKSLRLSYSQNDFEKTKMYQAILSWQNALPNYPILHRAGNQLTVSPQD